MTIILEQGFNSVKMSINWPILSDEILEEFPSSISVIMKKVYKNLIRKAHHTGFFEIPNKRPTVKMLVKVKLGQRKIINRKNLDVGLKILIDAINELQFIYDDSPEWMELELIQEKTYPFGLRYTEIEIKEIK